MINIEWRREPAPIYVMGRVDPLQFQRGRQSITVEVSDEDGEGTIVMSNEQQLFRLYEKLREVYEPRTITVTPPTQTTRPDVVDIPVQPYWTRTFEVNMPTDLPMEYTPAVPADTTGQVFTREALEEAMRTIEETPIQPTQYILTEEQMELAREMATTPPRRDTENYYEQTRLRRPRHDLGYIPGRYTEIRPPIAPQEITVDITIADDPADQESILQFMEKE